MGLSESHLSKLFAKEAGEKFIEYLTRIRIGKAKDLMRTTMKLYDISESVGYPNPEHFSRVFKKEADSVRDNTGTNRRNKNNQENNKKHHPQFTLN